jgi:Polyketide cyclase / dehydrase and lipid transport
MWSTEASAMGQAPPEAIWRLWADVDNWKEWDPGVGDSSIGGPFAEGTGYVLKPKGGPRVTSVLTDVRPGEGFSDRTRLPLANLDFFHEVQRVGEGTRVTHRVEISGPLSFVFARLMGRSFENGLPETVRNLARLAEERGGNRS